MFALVREIKISQYSDPKTVVGLLKAFRYDVTLQLKKLTVGDGALHDINPGLVSRALLKLKDCSIHEAQPGLVQAILAAITNSANISLRFLDLDLGEVLQVAPDIVAEAATKLETFMAWLSSAQVEAVLTRLATSQDSRLRQLVNYNSDTGNISSLDPEIVAGAFTKLEAVRLDLNWSLSSAQLAAIFSRIRESPVLRLRHLMLFAHNISHVSPLDLVKAIQRLEKFEFYLGGMTGEQATAILTMVKKNRLGKIKIIKIGFIYGVGYVSPSLIQRAKQNSALTWFG